MVTGTATASLGFVIPIRAVVPEIEQPEMLGILRVRLPLDVKQELEIRLVLSKPVAFGKSKTISPDRWIALPNIVAIFDASVTPLMSSLFMVSRKHSLLW